MMGDGCWRNTAHCVPRTASHLSSTKHSPQRQFRVVCWGMPRIDRWLALTTAALLTFAPAQANTPDNLREELITQALSGWDGSVTVKLLPGALPSGFPLKLAGLPGVRLVGSLVRTAPTPEQTGQTVIVGGQSVPLLTTSLRGALTQAGFKPYPSMPGEPSGGFLPSGGASRFPAAYYRYTQASTPAAGGQRANIVVYQQAGRTYGQIALGLAPRLAEDLRNAQRMGPDPLFGFPALTPPDGVNVLPTGVGGNGSSFTFTASIQGKLSATQLSEHYGKQLAAAGWQQISRSTPGNQIVTVWSVQRADDQGQTGILIVRQNNPELHTGVLMVISY